MAPTVSVLIPCKNAAKYLAETLDSARSQSLRPLEIIVVDDGSTDRSREITAEYGSDVALLSNPGRGASAARNHASAVAKGEFFQYLDADDLLEPHALASRVEALTTFAADVAISDWRRMEQRRGGWEPFRTESGKLPEPELPVDVAVLKGFWAPPAAILYRRSVCERIGGWRESLPVIQDARFLLDAARLGGTFVHVPGVGARYRQHASGSLSTESAVRFWSDVFRNAREVEDLWDRAGAITKAHRDVLADLYEQCERVGFGVDRELFERSQAELRRFPDHVSGQFVKAADRVSRWTGYGTARFLLAPFVR